MYIPCALYFFWSSRHLALDPTENSAVLSALLENSTLEPNMKGSADPLPRYGHLKFAKMSEKCEVRTPDSGLRRSVGCWSVVNIHTYYTEFRYVRNVQREE